MNPNQIKSPIKPFTASQADTERIAGTHTAYIQETPAKVITFGETDNYISVLFGARFLGVIYKEVDGYFVFKSNLTGFWESYALKLIATKLDQLNEKWDKQVKSLTDLSLVKPSYVAFCKKHPIL